MKTFFIFVAFLTASIVSSQSTEWVKIRPSNTGVAAEENYFVNGDRFGNIWTGGRSAIEHEGSVVRFNHRDTIFTSWSNFEGYIQSEWVYDAEIDNYDHLWVATADGLSKYDGTTWITYNTSNTPLPSDNIRSVTIDNQHNVWITFQEVNFVIGGIAKFDGTNWNIYTPGNSNLPNYECFDILIDSQNNKWIHSKFSVTKFDGINFSDYNSQNSGITGSEVLDVKLDSMGRMCALVQSPLYSEICIFDGANWTYINQTNTPAMAGHQFYRFFYKGSKLIMSGGGSNPVVLTFDGNTWSSHIAGDFIFDVYIDKDNNYWTSGLTTLSKLVGNQWNNYMRYSAGLSEHNNYNIFVDSHDRLWAANGNGGIQIFDCPKWESYGPWNQGLYPSPQTLSTVGAAICEDSFGNIWFAYHSTNGTVVKIPNGNYQNYAAWQIFDLNNSPVSWVEESFSDGFGNVFFYSDYGIHMYNNNTSSWTTWDLTNSPLQYDSYGFGTDLNGKAYFGGYQQLSTYNNGVWDSIHLPTIGANVTAVNDIAFDSINNMWLATDEGVWKYNGSSWTMWDSNNSSIVDNHVSSIDIAENGTVYISSFGASGFLNGGISIYNGSTWTSLTMENSGLPGEQIDDIDLDSRGNLWINTFTEGVTVYKGGGVSGLECIDRSLQVGTTGVQSNSIVVKEFSLAQNYPNPFNPTTNLEFTISRSGYVSLKVYDILGKVVATLVEADLIAGNHEYTFDGTVLSSGIYFYTLSSHGYTETKRMMLLK
jgi:ligand-binding sensor domain-containing protein